MAKILIISNCVECVYFSHVARDRIFQQVCAYKSSGRCAP